MTKIELVIVVYTSHKHLAYEKIQTERFHTLNVAASPRMQILVMCFTQQLKFINFYIKITITFNLIVTACGGRLITILGVALHSTPF
jgi:hypothetical protein